MPEFRATLEVRLRAGVLDPAGQAVGRSLRDLGFPVESVGVGKLLELTLQAPTRAQAEEAVRRMAAELLVNPVLEDYEIEIVQR